MKLYMPQDEEVICGLILTRMQVLEEDDRQLVIPLKGDPRLVSHQLELQDAVDDPSVRRGIDVLIGEGKVKLFEPAWVNTQPKDRSIDLRVLYAHTVT